MAGSVIVCATVMLVKNAQKNNVAKNRVLVINLDVFIYLHINAPRAFILN